MAKVEEYFSLLELKEMNKNQFIFDYETQVQKAKAIVKAHTFLNSQKKSPHVKSASRMQNDLIKVLGGTTSRERFIRSNESRNVKVVYQRSGLNFTTCAILPKKMVQERTESRARDNEYLSRKSPALNVVKQVSVVIPDEPPLTVRKGVF